MHKFLGMGNNMINTICCWFKERKKEQDKKSCKLDFYLKALNQVEKLMSIEWQTKQWIEWNY